jgi:hypothetical protein
VEASGLASFKDGSGTNAWFSMLVALAIDADENFYVADAGNAAIRHVNLQANLAVTTLRISGEDAPMPPVSPWPSDSGENPDSPSDGGGGGGALSAWVLIAIVVLVIVRRSTRAAKISR